MVQCNYCKTDIETETAFCPFCGKSRLTPLERRQRLKNGVRYGVQAAILILGIVNAAVLIHHAAIPHTQVVNEGPAYTQNVVQNTTTIVQNMSFPDMVHRVYYKEYLGNIVAPHYTYYAITNVSTNITVDPGDRVYLMFNCKIAAGSNALSISFYIGIDGVRETTARASCSISGTHTTVCFQYWNTTLPAGDHQIDIFTYLSVAGSDQNLHDPMLWIQTYYNATL
jgi:hypothetical protein